MDKDYLIFISHNSEDTELARELKKILLEGNSDLEGQIFLDCDELEGETNWYDAMMQAVDNSRHLIFVTSKLEYLRKGWVREEVFEFKNCQVEHGEDGREKNVSYFGIFLCDVDFKNDLFSDRKQGGGNSGLYRAPEHLVLGEDVTLRDAKNRIVNKVKAMLEEGVYDDNAQQMVDGSDAFMKTLVERSNGTVLAPDAIDDRLLPPIKLLSAAMEEEKEGQSTDRLTFQGLCDLVKENHVRIIGREGGCGKTTLMLKLFYHHMQQCESDFDNRLIPLYVDAKALAAKADLIQRYLAHTVLKDKWAMKDNGSIGKARQVDAIFSEKREKPRYLLLIDGYNELPEGSVEQLNEELEEFLPGGRYGKSVRVVISGRSIAAELPEAAFQTVELQNLDDAAVCGYLNQRTLSNSLKKILNKPLYLKMYADTDVHRDIRTRTDLLCAFLDRQEKKDKASAGEKKSIACYHMYLRHVFPAVAHEMMSGGTGESSFVLSQDAMEELFKKVYDRITDKLYKRFNGDAYAVFLKNSGIPAEDDMDLRIGFKTYAQDICKLMNEYSTGNYDFVHQIYRDFFCAWYLAEEIRFGLKKKERTAVLSRMIFDDDVIEFAAELLKESYPRYRQDTGRWDYSCNEESCLVQLLEMLHGEAPDDKISIANIVKMLRHVRWKDLSGLDFSGMDLTAADLRDCTFSHYDRTATYATSFFRAKINKDNLFAERHYNQLRAACTNKDYIACLDMGGFLKLWEKTMYPKFPVQVLTDLRCAATKLLFAPDGERLYAMTLHDILEVPLPDRSVSFVSRAEPKLLFRTPYQLQDMKLDARGDLLFSVHTNPFDYKPISNPDTPDEIGIYTVASAAAVCGDGSCLACGTVIDHDELRFYDKQPDGTWKERQFGFGRILDDYIGELKELFRSMGVYEAFTRDKKGNDMGDAYFRYTRDRFMDRTHHYETLPVTVAGSCTDYLTSKDIRLNGDQKKQLYELNGKYMQRIKTALDEEGVLIHLCGRRITGLSFHENNQTLLLSGTIDYARKLQTPENDSEKTGEQNSPEDGNKEEKQSGKKKVNNKISCSNWVVTLDKDTLDARVINMHRGENPSRAFYSGDDIVVMTRYQVNVYDEKGAEVALLRPDIHRFRGVFSIPGRDTFYAISNHNIYEMDRDLRCVRSIRNNLNESELFYIVDDRGGEYLARKGNGRKGEKKNKKFEKNGKVIDLHSGSMQFFPDSFSENGRTGTRTDIGSMRYTTRGNYLLAFEDGIQTAQTAVHHSLHLCGCDFREVQGSVKDPVYLQILYRMGAETDPVELPRVEHVTDAEQFVPSNDRYGRQKGLSPDSYAYREGMVLKGVGKANGKTGNLTSAQRTWDLIRTGTADRNELDATDYAILEWVDRLRYATPDMLKTLSLAGLLPPVTQRRNVEYRVTGDLYSKCKFLYHSKFMTEGEELETPIVTVSFPFGSQLLSCITGEEPKKLPALKKKRKKRAAEQEEEILPEEEAGPEEEAEQETEEKKAAQISDPETLKDVLKTLSVNSWFCATAQKFRGCIEDYALHEQFDTNLFFEGSGKVYGYLSLGGQPFFANAMRDLGEEELEEDADKVKRLCLLALHYRTVVCQGQQLAGLKRQPVLVLICESFDQCRRLSERVKDIYPQVRKLYTFDSLLEARQSGAGCYFEFCDGAAKHVRLDSLFGNDK